MLPSVLCGEAPKFITNILIKYCLQFNVLNRFITSLCVDFSKFSIDRVCGLFLGPNDIRQTQDPAGKVSMAIVPDMHLFSQTMLKFFYKHSN